MHHRERCVAPVELSMLLALLLLGMHGGTAISVAPNARLPQQQPSPMYAVGSAQIVACRSVCESKQTACCTINGEVACRTDCARSKFRCDQSCGPRMPTCQAGCFEGYFDCMGGCATADGQQLRAACTRTCSARHMGFKGCLMACRRAKSGF